MKFGVKTGANEFFYLKNINHLFETDRLAEPKLFEDQGVEAKTLNELKSIGLAYMEGQNGERFIIEQESVKPLLRSVRNFVSPHIRNSPNTYCLYLKSAVSKNMRFTARYIKAGEKKVVEVTRGSRKKRVMGYGSLSSIQARPTWYILPSLKPAKIALPELYSERFLTFFCDVPCLADHLFDVIYPKKENERIFGST